MELNLQREPSDRHTTFGELRIDGTHECLPLEDEIREIPGQRVSSWKIKRATAVPAGRYRITLENSQRFGPETITINAVPGYISIRMHGGTDIEDTEGCVVVGDSADRERMTISGAKFNHVLDRLKARIKAAIAIGGEVWIEIRNPVTTV